MKNYLVKTLFEVRDPKWSKDINRSHENAVFEKYQQMHELSVISAEACLEGDWELVFYGGQTENIHQALKDTFYKIYDLWSSEPCNILYTDPDTLMVAPTSIFGEYDKFMMYNVTDPKSFNEPNQYGKSYSHFMNAGVRYFPASMSKYIWDIGLKMAETWDLTDWNTEQIILNEMLWSQGLTPEQAIDPTVAYQAFMLPGGETWADQWNGCKFEDSKIVHWHGSRNAEIKLEIMNSVAKQINLI